LIRWEGAIAIVVNLDVMLAKRKMKLNDLSVAVGVSVPNLSVLKTGKAKAVRFSTLEAICRVLDCQPGDILEYRPDCHDGGIPRVPTECIPSDHPDDV
jgi:putative transcriptional regulator